MPETKSVSRVETPNTISSLKRELAALGVKPGMTMIVHTSLSSLGWVCGGPVAVIQALMNVVTSSGTIVMPTHSSGNTEPSNWKYPPVPEPWWPIIRSEMPAFDREQTPTAMMGAVAETFRTFPGVLRSYHPYVSFAAWGRYAEHVTSNHGLEFSLGERSPLARIYELDGSILLLGTGHESNTSLHLSEVRSASLEEKLEGGAIISEGQRTWVNYRDLEYDSDDFGHLGLHFEASNPVLRAKIGAATARLLSQRQIVDFGVRWIHENRPPKP